MGTLDAVDRRKMEEGKARLLPLLESFVAGREVGDYMALLNIAAAMLVEQRFEMLKKDPDFDRENFEGDLETGIQNSHLAFELFVKEALDRRFAS